MYIIILPGIIYSNIVIVATITNTTRGAPPRTTRKKPGIGRAISLFSLSAGIGLAKERNLESRKIY